MSRRFWSSFCSWNWWSMQNNLELTRRILNSRGYIQIPSRGISMTPLIRSGDICQFEPLRDALKDAKLGDVLLYVTDDGDLIGHRYVGAVVRDGETLMVFKGDFNRNSDAPIAPRQVVGRMITRGWGMKLWGLVITRFPILSLGVQKLYGRERKRWLFW